MITIGQLVDAVALSLNLDVGTVGLVARNLRDDGQLPKHGRGPSAARMTWLSGARILTALLATSSPKDAANAVRFFGSLPCRKTSRDENASPDVVNLIDEFGLPASHSFAQAIQLLLQAYAEPQKRAILKKGAFRLGDDHAFLPMLTVAIHDTSLCAEIFLHGTTYEYGDELALQISLGATTPFKNSGRYKALLALPFAKRGGGLRTHRVVMWPEVGPIADALAGYPTPTLEEARTLLKKARHLQNQISREPGSKDQGMRLLDLHRDQVRLHQIIKWREHRK